MNINQSVEYQVKERLETDTKSLQAFKIFAKSILDKDEWGYLKHPKEIRSYALTNYVKYVLPEIDKAIATFYNHLKFSNNYQSYK